jgi:hypothetical protein
MDTDSVVKIFSALDSETEVEVIPDQQKGKVHFKDKRTNKEYIVMSESEIEREVTSAIHDTFSESDYIDDEEDFDFIPEYEEDEEEDFDFIPEYEEDEEEEFDFPKEEEGFESSYGIQYEDETLYEIEMEDGMDMMEMDNEMDMMEMDMEDETLYEIEMEEDDEDFESDEYMMESKKSTKKPKGMGFGSASKFKFPSKTTDYPTKKQKQGTKGVGMGKGPKKDIYKSDSPSFDGEFSKKPTKSKETKGSMMMKPKKVETKEAARTLGNGKYWGRDGLPKPRTAPRHLRNESVESQELNLLREKNEEYRKALNIFRTKLDEVAIFNSNLAYATRLFTEHSTSKQEKINILQRFDGVETLKESKNLYKVIKDELSNTKTQQVNESIERTITKTPSTGSAINLIESKTYENPQFLRMKDLMSKLK